MINMDEKQPLNLATLKCAIVKLKDGFLNVPVFLLDAFNLLYCGGIKSVDIFRKSCNMQRIKNIKCPFYGEFCLPEGTTIYDVCFLIKQFFRQLEEPLLTEALESQFLHFQMSGCETTRIRSVLELCNILPPRHRETLAYLMCKLQNVAQYSEHNKMDTKNLALVFTESIFRNSSSYDPLANAEERMQKQMQDNEAKANLLELLIDNAENIAPVSEYKQIMLPDKYNKWISEDREWDAHSNESAQHSGSNDEVSRQTDFPAPKVLQKHSSSSSVPVKKVSMMAFGEAEIKPSDMHMKITKAVKSNLSQNDEEVSDKKRKKPIPVNCRVCGILCYNGNRYLKHFKKYHAEYILEDMYDNCWKCDHCYNVYPTLKSLQKHWIVQHNKLYSKETFRDFAERASDGINSEFVCFSSQQKSFTGESSTWEASAENDDNVEAPSAQVDQPALKSPKKHCALYSVKVKKFSMKALSEAKFIPTDQQMKIVHSVESNPAQDDGEGGTQKKAPNNCKKTNHATCRVCGMSCYSTQVYRKHFKEQHPEYSLEDMYDNGWNCDQCSEVFPSLHGLKLHRIRLHNKSYNKEISKAFTEQVSGGINTDVSPVSSEVNLFTSESNSR